jgi:TRAP transporter TAXI family solute receptor
MPRKLAFVCSTLLLGLSLGLGASSAVAAEKLDKPVHVRFATARPGITWYSYAGILRPELLKVLPSGSDVTIMNTALAIANAKLLAGQRADIGFSYPPVIAWAEKGFGPFPKPVQNLRGLIGSLDQYYQRITLQKNSPINSLAEIKAKHLAVHIGTNTPGSLNEYMTRLILQAYGLTYADIKSYGGSVTEAGLPVLSNLFQQGRIDMIIGITTDGHPNTAQLATAPGEKFLGLDDHAVHFLEGYGFAPTTMPANLFEGQTQPIKGVGFRSAIYVNASMSNAEAYLLTKAIMASRPQLRKSFKRMSVWTPEDSIAPHNLRAPLHPGAQEYFKEIGVLH